MADKRRSLPRSTKAAESTDLMQEKLEKWRRMKGRSSSCVQINRSKSAVMLDKNTQRLQKRKAKGAWINEKLKEKENSSRGYKRLSDLSNNLADTKKRRKTFNVAQRESPVSYSLKPRRSNITAGQSKTHMDKSLSMRERLELWRAEKGKHNPAKPAGKSEKTKTKKLNRMSKENVHCYHKLENDDLLHTPASTRPVLQSQAKSTIRKRAYVTPYHPSDLKTKSNKKSVAKQSLCNTRAVLASNVDRICETGVKLYNNKALDMRERLELWLAEKGKTPKYKTPSVLKQSSCIQTRNEPVQFEAEKKRLSFDCCGREADGATSPGEEENIEEKLQECLKQLEKENCDLEEIAAKLDLYSSCCPHTSGIANYWLCRARIAQQEKDFDRVVCLLEQAFVFKAQPESVLKDAVCDFVVLMKENGQQDTDTDDISQLPVTPAANIDISDSSLDELTSSVIKFCLTEATPYRNKFKATYGKHVLTPVRRSVRLERASAQHPSVVQEHGLTVRTLGELPEGIRQDVLYKPNFAVRAELNEAWNELQLDYSDQ